MEEEQVHQVSLKDRPQIRLLLVLPLLVLAFVNKTWYTLYLVICFCFLFLLIDWFELGVKLSGLREGLHGTWFIFVLSLVATPPIVWTLVNQYLPEFWTHVFGRFEFVDPISTMVATIIMIPFIEEVIFRGLAQQQLSQLTNDSTALLVASAIFATVHWSPGVPLVVGVDLLLVFVDSIWFGLIFMKSRNTILSTLCHSLGNLVFILNGVCVIGVVV